MLWVGFVAMVVMGSFFNLAWHAYVCVCVCVCERERDQFWRKMGAFINFVWFWTHPMDMKLDWFILCVIICCIFFFFGLCFACPIQHGDQCWLFPLIPQQIHYLTQCHLKLFYTTSKLVPHLWTTSCFCLCLKFKPTSNIGDWILIPILLDWILEEEEHKGKGNRGVNLSIIYKII